MSDLSSSLPSHSNTATICEKKITDSHRQAQWLRVTRNAVGREENQLSQTRKYLIGVFIIKILSNVQNSFAVKPVPDIHKLRAWAIDCHRTICLRRGCETMSMPYKHPCIQPHTRHFLALNMIPGVKSSQGSTSLRP
jgi:hypothetical protein